MAASNALLGGWAIVLAGLFGLAALGALGPLQVCGIDRAAVCVNWPAPASAALWLSFLVAIAALAFRQARVARRLAHRFERPAIVVISLLAAAERLWRIHLTQLGYDESAAASLVAAWRSDGTVPADWHRLVRSVFRIRPHGRICWRSCCCPLARRTPCWDWASRDGLLGIWLTWWVGRRWIGPWGGTGRGDLLRGRLLGGLPGPWRLAAGLPAGARSSVSGRLAGLAVRRWPWALALACGWWR